MSAPQTIYSELSERENRDKVYARLEAFLPHIVWVDSPSEALAKLESGEVRFAAGFSGRAFRKTIAGSFSAIWDGHVYDYLSWAISSKTNDKETAKKFVELATSPARLVDQAKQWPYGPMRKSAAASVGRHATLGIELAPFMPTSELRLSQGIRHDSEFWQKHGERLNDRLTALLEGFPRGVRIPPPTRKPEVPTETQKPIDTTTTAPNATWRSITANDPQLSTPAASSWISTTVPSPRLLFTTISAPSAHTADASRGSPVLVLSPCF